MISWDSTDQIPCS